ncbi:FecR family protein [Sphingobacterium sp. UT-1RO-CII-1]|uniref:FecR family protein n=1 Tax=Sphingobacterium sp. UT-1RO-CII-1 TaxID=2995225 RepID=UPI00227C52E6|nr:FecR family protein [Sphingobacterium sp. UT-1RO-CII-1]MCY4779622.1 FecR family protein [Sphingobacterium sp. UT-1RO-CII-1]
MDKQHIAELIEKHLDGTASPAEYQQLLDWYRSVEHTEIHWPETEKQFDIRVDRILTNILSQDRHKKAPHLFQRKSFLIPTISIAAAAILVLLLVTNLFNKDQIKDTVLAEATTIILPGGNKAILTLSDGSVIDLTDSLHSYNNNREDGLKIYTNQGELTFNSSDYSTLSSNNLNTLSTPRGGQYMVNLPDGSKVWLNAESSLSFPNTFNPNERRVTLNGEAYFDIAKNKKAPFIVSVDDMQIEVLGTKFNVDAYKDSPRISTTLVEGSVKVSQGMQNIVLEPNQQSSWDKRSKKFSIQDIDTKLSTAWKNGYFIFENTNIKTIMSQLSRWYDIEVEYLGDISKKEYTGSILKRSTIQEVLNMLELTGTIEFKITGRRVSVMP